MKFSDKKAMGCLQPITLGGTRIYTLHTGLWWSWRTLTYLARHRTLYMVEDRGIFLSFCNKTSQTKKPMFQVRDNSSEFTETRERESHPVIYLEDLDRNVAIPTLAPVPALQYAPV